MAIKRSTLIALEVLSEAMILFSAFFFAFSIAFLQAGSIRTDIFSLSVVALLAGFVGKVVFRILLDRD